MTKKVNLKTIADDLKLSVGTVSRVLNGKAKEYRIKDETVKKVKQYASNMGYTPNMVAKGLRSSKTFTIGLMIPDIANPFFSMMAKNIEKAASEANYSILLVDASESIEKEKDQVQNMLNRKVDAIIAAPVGTEFDHFQLITKQKIPLVFVDRYSTEIDIPYITSNNFQGGFSATQYLIDKGHKRIALITGCETIQPIIERRKGYVKALEVANIAVSDQLIVGEELTVNNGYEHAKLLLQRNNRPTAIFALSNLIGLGVLQAVKELNLNIPNDVSLIVFDDQPYVSYLNPPVTTVKQDSKKIGALSIEIILGMIKYKNTKPDSQVVETQLIRRESVVCLGN